MQSCEIEKVVRQFPGSWAEVSGSSICREPWSMRAARPWSAKAEASVTAYGSGKDVDREARRTRARE